MRAIASQWMLCGLLLGALPEVSAASTATSAPVHGALVDQLGVGHVQQVGGQDYHLAFVGPPQPNRFVLQEYLPAGQQLDSYHSMLLLNHLPTEATPLQFARDMLQQIHARRDRGDRLANGELLEGEAGSAVLDFVLSTPLPDGRLVVEWNAYHYRQQAGGITMTALSRRVYGEQAAQAFLGELKTRRHSDRQALLGWLPQVTPPR